MRIVNLLFSITKNENRKLDFSCKTWSPRHKKNKKGNLMAYSETQMKKIWSKGRVVPGYDPNEYRQDAFGNWIVWSKRGKQDDFGWEVDHIIPLSKGGSDALRNLQPLHWFNNRRKADNHW